MILVRARSETTPMSIVSTSRAAYENGLDYWALPLAVSTQFISCDV